MPVIVACDGCGVELEPRPPSHVKAHNFCPNCRGAISRVTRGAEIEDRRRRVEELHLQGLNSARAIGRELGVHHETVSRDLHLMGYYDVERSDGVTRAHRARRRQLEIPEEKTCKRCGSVFTRSEVRNTNLAHWLAREHCTFECAHGPKPEERFCEYWACWKLYTPKDNDPDDRFCSRECGQRARRDRGDIHAAFMRAINGTPRFIDEQPGDVRRKLRLKSVKSPGAPHKYHPETRELVRKLRNEGRSWNEIERETGVPRDTAREMAGARQRRS
jgi:Helix-turn-helix domain